MGYLPALEKSNKGEMQRKEPCLHLENHCRAPCSLKRKDAQRLPADLRASGVGAGAGSKEVPGHLGTASLLSFLQVVWELCLGRQADPQSWGVAQAAGFLTVSLFLLLFFAPFSQIIS